MKEHHSFDIYEAAYLRTCGDELLETKLINDCTMFIFDATVECKAHVYDYEHGGTDVGVCAFTHYLDELKDKLFAKTRG
ncbi:MAG: DUF5659 domain-containing protein [Microgenomates group bacterium]